MLRPLREQPTPDHGPSNPQATSTPSEPLPPGDPRRDAAAKMYSGEEVSAIVQRRLAVQERKHQAQIAQVAEASARAAIARVGTDAHERVSRAQQSADEMVRRVVRLSGLSVQDIELRASLERSRARRVADAEQADRDHEEWLAARRAERDAAPVPRTPYRSPTLAGHGGPAPTTAPSARQDFERRAREDGITSGVRPELFRKGT